METNYTIKLSAADTEVYHAASWRRSGLQNTAEDEANERGCEVLLVDSEGAILFRVSPRRGNQ